MGAEQRIDSHAPAVAVASIPMGSMVCQIVRHEADERGNTDRFEIDVPGQRLSVELIRAIGTISILKLEDSFFGGGWDFGGIQVWVNQVTGPPLYENLQVNESLDGGHLDWHADLDDPGLARGCVVGQGRRSPLPRKRLES